MRGAALDAVLDELADRVARRVLDALRAGSAPDMVDQHASPLGPRRHAAAVRRRVAAAQPGAAVVGRRLLLSRAALNDELARPARAKQEAARSDGSDLAAELGLRVMRGGK